MAQRWRKSGNGQKSVAKALDNEALEALALGYAGRYAASRSKLIAYLSRKLRERGWIDESQAPDEAIERVADRLVALRYVDDSAYAAMKSQSMQRRGLGARRIAQKLHADGVGERDRSEAAPDRAERWASAERLSRKKRIGPFAELPPDRAKKEKQIAAFIRAGHDVDTARRWIEAAPGEIPEPPDDRS